MYQRRGVSIWNLIICLTVAYTIMPIVSRFISTYLTTYFYLLVVIIVFLGIVFGARSRSVNEYAGGVLLPFILFQGCSFFTRTDSIVVWGYSVLLALLPVVIGYYSTQHRIYDISFYSRAIIFMMLATAITTSFGLIKFPYAARVLATVSSSQDATAIIYSWYNIGGYEYIYSLVLLYPILIMAYKQRRVNLIFTIVGVGLIFAVTVLSEYTTALLLLLISSFLFFVKRDLRKKDVFILFLIAIFFVAVFNDYVSQFLSYVGTLTGSETMIERLNALAGGQAGLEASESNRIFLYRRSISTFLDHPLLGTFLSGGGGLGGHSFILDTLGKYGSIGVALLFFMYRKVFRFFVKPFENKTGYGFVLWTFLQTILLSCINTGMWLEVLALMMPILVCKIYDYEGLNYEDSLDY